MKQLIIAFLISLTTVNGCLAQEQIESYEVQGKVPAIQQPNDMACWITVYTMMRCWKDNKNYTVEQTAEALGEPWMTYYQVDAGLPPDDERKFMRRAGLKSEPPASYLLVVYVDWLKQYGPLWIVTGGLSGRHARLLTGIDGDGTYDKTSFIFIDPASGTSLRENVRNFFDKYEHEAKLANVFDWELHLQIFHF